MKVWMRVRRDKEMNLDVPHSINIATAMYGFRELGAEIVPYYFIDEIEEQIGSDDIVLDYIEQCQWVFKKFGHPTYLDCYPERLKPFLKRKIWRDTINSFSSNEEKWSAGYFIKPVKDKAFTGKIIRNTADLIGCGNSMEDYEILVSEPIDILAEWRCFIMYDRIIDVRPYGSVSDLNHQGYRYHYDEEFLDELMTEFRKWQDRPAACSIDICYCKDGQSRMVESNDAYALGCYGLPSLLYAKFISARWSQIFEREDEYHF